MTDRARPRFALLDSLRGLAAFLGALLLLALWPWRRLLSFLLAPRGGESAAEPVPGAEPRWSPGRAVLEDFKGAYATVIVWLGILAAWPFAWVWRKLRARRS